MRIEESIDIRRSIEEVWRFVSDPANDPLWCPKVEAVESTAAGRWTVMHKPVPLRPAKALVVTRELTEPPCRLKLREEDDASVFEIEYRLASGRDAVRFSQVSEFEWKKLSRLLRPLFGGGVRRDVRRQLRALKRVLEDAAAT